eukprot:554132-Lingulodinium_polyedra.AAC.1
MLMVLAPRLEERNPLHRAAAALDHVDIVERGVTNFRQPTLSHALNYETVQTGGVTLAPRGARPKDKSR